MAPMNSDKMRLVGLIVATYVAVSTAFVYPTVSFTSRHEKTLFMSSVEAAIAQPSELPDSLDDAAEIAALQSLKFSESAGPLSRCRVDFDTSVGDETFTLLKSSTDFMQKFLSALSYAMIPGLQEQRQEEMMRVSQAKAELKALLNSEEALTKDEEEKKEELMNIVESNGRDPSYKWEGPKARIYFPDEGSAALARRDWSDLVPPCVEYASCGGVQLNDISKDMVIFFFCPKASESEYVEELLQETETKADDLRLTVFVNPNLVDMGVTGFGMAGRLLRERLIDKLTYTYYLRTLSWGALTRRWPQAFSVWQEDENANGGYRLISTLDRLPSNPEVEDIYDLENGDGTPGEGLGLLDSLGDFVNGMMKL